MSRVKISAKKAENGADELICSLAHEIRNPLSSIKMNVEMLYDYVRGISGPENSRENCRIALEEIEHLERILGAAQDASRPGLRLKEEDLGEIIKAALCMAAKEISDKGIRVMVQAGELPRLSVDGVKLKQALLNVFLNAAHAMRPGGRLCVQVRGDGESVYIEVSDDGEGMDREVLSRAFEPFFSRRPGGSGLGMHLVRKILREHGGEVGLQSEPGKGTTVKLVLPAAPGRAAGAAGK